MKIKPAKQWFALGPGTEEDGREYHWYNTCWEYHGTRIDVRVGDVWADNEDQNGGYEGAAFTLELLLFQGDMESAFYLPDNPRASFDVHSLDFCFWRWGFTILVRGRVNGEISWWRS